MAHSCGQVEDEREELDCEPGAPLVRKVFGGCVSILRMSVAEVFRRSL